MSDPVIPTTNPMNSVLWGPLLVSNEQWLRNVIRARTGESQTVDDIYQQLALIAHQHAESLRDPNRAAPWLHRVAVILCARYCRTQGRERKKIQQVASQTSETEHFEPLDYLISIERHQIIQQAVRSLEPRDREILVLKYQERMSYRQLSDRMGITERAVDRRLCRARSSLRTELRRRGIRDNET